MTVAEAIRAFLDEYKDGPMEQLNDQADWLDLHVMDVVTEWFDSNGFEFNDATDRWERVQ